MCVLRGYDEAVDAAQAELELFSLSCSGKDMVTLILESQYIGMVFLPGLRRISERFGLTPEIVKRLVQSQPAYFYRCCFVGSRTEHAIIPHRVKEFVTAFPALREVHRIYSGNLEDAIEVLKTTKAETMAILAIERITDGHYGEFTLGMAYQTAFYWPELWTGLRLFNKGIEIPSSGLQDFLIRLRHEVPTLSQLPPSLANLVLEGM